MSELVLNGASLLRAVAALGGVLGLIAAIGWLLRRHGGAVGMQARGANARLAVVATQAVDARTRLVLVQRDRTEHLLAVGPTGVTVIESLPAAAADPGDNTRA
jgi:flagellar biogenesis protein FliO